MLCEKCGKRPVARRNKDAKLARLCEECFKSLLDLMCENIMAEINNADWNKQISAASEEGRFVETTSRTQ